VDDALQGLDKEVVADLAGFTQQIEQIGAQLRTLIGIKLR